MMRLDVGHRPVKNYSLHHIEKLPADFVGQSVETFGIIALESSFIGTYNMRSGEGSKISQQRLSTNAIKTKMLELSFLPIINFEKEGYSARNFLYRYLAQRQHTLHAVVPIHTKEEVLLYKKLLIEKKKELFNSRNSATPDFEIFAKLWSAFADGKEIYYKTPEHIKVYFNKRAEASVFTNSIALNENICRNIRSILERPERMNASVAMLKQPTPINHYKNVQFGSYSGLITQHQKNNNQALRPAPLAPKCLPVSTPSPSLILPLVPPPSRSPTSTNPVTKKAKRSNRICFVCKDSSSCSGRSKSKYCVNKCGICLNDNCSGRYKISDCQF